MTQIEEPRTPTCGKARNPAQQPYGRTSGYRRTGAISKKPMQAERIRKFFLTQTNSSINKIRNDDNIVAEFISAVNVI